MGAQRFVDESNREERSKKREEADARALKDPATRVRTEEDKPAKEGRRNCQ